MTRVVAALAAVCAAVAIVSLNSGVRAQEPSRIPPGLLAKAQASGSVRVIVGVRAPFTPEGRLQSVDEVRGQRQGIADVQTAVVNRLEGFGPTNARRFPYIPYFAAELNAAALTYLASQPDVTSVQEDIPVPPTLAESAPLINAPNAWSAGYTGSGWTVAVLDTGVQTSHPFLGGNLISEACFSSHNVHLVVGMTDYGFTTSLCPANAASSTAAGSGANCTWESGCAHGTHVSGIATGRNYIGGPGFNGVGKGASLIAIQIFTGFPAAYPPCAPAGGPCVLAFTSDQILGLQRVQALAGTYHIAAVNMSLGGGRFFDQATCDSSGPNPAEKTAIDSLRSLGIATVIASGNDGFTGSTGAPGCISSAISVGSVGDGSFGATANVVSAFSNSASFLNLLAPGQWITSSVATNVTPFATWGTWSGTSMATPHVAGAWALMKQRKPLASVTEILNAFATTGLNVTDTRGIAPGDTTGGYTKPRINVNAAINALRVDYMNIDAPAASSTWKQPFNVSGWALNMSAPLGTNSGVDRVDFYATPAGGGGAILLGFTTAFSARSDVASAFGAAQFTNSGFTFPVHGLPQGTYTFSAYARNTFTATFTQVASAPNVVVLDDPLISLDAPANGSIITEPSGLGGWAIDRAAAVGTGVDTVHVYAYPNPGSGTPPIFLGVAAYGAARTDVGGAFGSQFTNSGFNLTLTSANLPPGPYLIVAYPHSSVMGAFTTPAQAAVTVSEPNLSIDTPANGAHPGTSFNVGGWAIDRGALTGTGIDAIHVWIYPNPGSGTPPIFGGVATYGFARGDVGAAFGAHFTNCGYNRTVGPLDPGTYRISVYAHSTITGTFSIVRAVDVVVP